MMMEDSIDVTRAFLPQRTDTNEHHRAERLIIKAQLGNDIRKLIIHNEDLTLNELSLMMTRIFKTSLSNDDELTIKYLDNEGDKVTLCDDSDLKLALQNGQELRLFVVTHKISVVSNQSKRNHLLDTSWINAETFKTELQQIRNSVQAILDKLPLEKNPNVEISDTNVKTPVMNTNTSTIPFQSTNQIDSLASVPTSTTVSNTGSSTSNQSSLNDKTNPSMSRTPSIEFTKESASSTTNPFSLPRSLLSSGRYPTQKTIAMPTSSTTNTTYPGVVSSSKISTPPNYSTTTGSHQNLSSSHLTQSGSFQQNTSNTFQTRQNLNTNSTGFSSAQANSSWNQSATGPNSFARFPYRSQ